MISNVTGDITKCSNLSVCLFPCSVVEMCFKSGEYGNEQVNIVDS